MLTGSPFALARKRIFIRCDASAVCKRFISITISVQHAWTRRALRRWGSRYSISAMSILGWKEPVDLIHLNV
jgi:hypothetical protein